MNKRRLLTAAAGAALLLGVATAAVFAKPGAGVFELDADNPPAEPAITDNTGSGLPDDWDRVAAGTSHANATTFDAETTATGTANNATIFTGGGSKDPLVISGWGWKDASGGLPDKDNLLHAMSARYNDFNQNGTAGTNSYLYFAADRYDNSGDAQIGFWFFQSPVATAANGAFSGSHVARNTATGQHGDVLVLSDFTQGGTQPTIRIYEWVGSGGSDGSLDLIGGDATGVRDCAVVSTDDFCASVNPTDGATAPWLFKNKSGQTTFAHGEFYEGGINLNNLGLQDACFPSFLAETRSSQSTTATLKDFVSGSFQNCSPTLVTTPSATVASPVTPGTAVHDTLVVTGQGVAHPPTPTGTVTFFMCGPAASGLCDGTTGHVGTSIGTGTLSGSNGSATATSPDVNGTTALAPGRYCFRSEWPGDDIYKPVPPATTFVEFGTGNSECFSVTKIDTQTVTTPVDGSGTPTTQINLGDSIQDKAVVTGTAIGGDPTGSVKFFVCKLASGTCDGTTNVGTQVGSPSTGETLASDGVAGTFTSNAISDALTPTSVGRYCFRAEYGGSSVYNTSADSTATECFQVGKLPSTTVTTPGSGSINLGQSITDTAVVTGSVAGGDPTGSVNFFVCGPIASGSCDGTTNVGTAVTGNPQTLASDGVAGTYTSSATSGSYTPPTPGRYCFRAEYGGDDSYFGSADGRTSECFTVNKLPTGTVTSPSSATINIGQSITDTAVVTGALAGGDPTGDVNFFVCGPLVSGSCDGTTNVGTAVTGNPKSLVSDGAAGTYTSSATSGSYVPPTPGRYCFRAAYGGDTNYTGSSDGSLTECFTVNKLPTTTVTTPSLGTITLGGTITDSAVVTGAAGGGDPTGAVKFFVCKIESGTCDGTTNVGTQVGAPASGEALVSDGVDATFTSNATSDVYTPSAVGRYCFRAEYGGDSNYTGSQDGTATECFTVTDTFANTSAQTWLPNDTATVAAAHGSPLSGTLTATLYPTNNCTGTAVSGQTYSKTLTGATTAADRTLTTTNSSYSVLASTSVSWLVTFTSGSTYITGTTHCESTSLTITN